MKQSTRDKLFEAEEYCDDNDKSTEFMIQYLQDHANVSLDTAISFMTKNNTKAREEWKNRTKLK